MDEVLMLSALLPLMLPTAMTLASVIQEVVECKLVQVNHQTVVASHHIAMPVREKDQSKSNPGDNSSDIYYSEHTSLLWEKKRERTLQMANELRCHSQSTKQLHWDWSAAIKRQLIDVGGAVPLIYWKEGTTGWCYFRHLTIGLLLWAAGNLLERGSKQPQTLPHPWPQNRQRGWKDSWVNKVWYTPIPSVTSGERELKRSCFIIRILLSDGLARRLENSLGRYQPIPCSWVSR